MGKGGGQNVNFKWYNKRRGEWVMSKMPHSGIIFFSFLFKKKKSTNIIKHLNPEIFITEL